MPADMTLEEFSDFEFLHVVNDTMQHNGDEGGWVSAAEIATQIGLGSRDRPAKHVGSRLSWARRFGYVEIDPDQRPTRWRLTEVGRALLTPKRVPAAVQRALDAMQLEPGQRAAVIDLLTKDISQGGRVEAHLVRRTFRHNAGGWRDPALA